MNGVTIKQAIEQSGLSNNYIRKAIAKGDLIVEKELVPGTQNNWRNVIVNFEEWRASTKARSTREDGRNKFVLYMNADEQAELEQLLIDAGLIAIQPVRANQKPAAEAE